MVTVDDKALSQLESAMKEGQYLRLGVRGGGCSGFEYMLKIDETFDENDDTLYKNGIINVIVNSESKPFIEGSTITWAEESLQSGFVVSNPNHFSCGCGTSFRPKDAESCGI
jgi:iron-sulfur cluster assembly protein